MYVYMYVHLSICNSHPIPPSCSEFVQLYAYPNTKWTDVSEIFKSVLATDKPTITAVEVAEKEEPTKSYKCYEIPLKPGTDTKQLLTELNKKKTGIVKRITIVKREDHEEGTVHPREDTDTAICVIL